MLARDIMAAPVVSIKSEAAIGEAIELMLKSHFSGLPVVDADNKLVGILSEGDLLRRAELGTEIRRPRWIETFLLPGRTAQNYVRTHGRIIDEVMTRELVTIADSAPLDEIVTLMERNHIKRVPVLRGEVLVGIVTRVDLLRALAAAARTKPPIGARDDQLRHAVEASIYAQDWAPGSSIRVEVNDGVVELSGTILDYRFRDAIRVCAENTPGVKAVHDHVVFVEPYTGAYIDPEELRTSP